MLHSSKSGLGEILNSMTGTLYRKPVASKSVAKIETHKRVILDKLRDQLITKKFGQRNDDSYT